MVLVVVRLTDSVHYIVNDALDQHHPLTTFFQRLRPDTADGKMYTRYECILSEVMSPSHMHRCGAVRYMLEQLMLVSFLALYVYVLLASPTDAASCADVCSLSGAEWALTIFGAGGLVYEVECVTHWLST